LKTKRGRVRLWNRQIPKSKKSGDGKISSREARKEKMSEPAVMMD
jgi:hypothetical protein